MIRHYWEVLFSTEYFPYWEFTMLMMLALQLSMIIRLNRIEKKQDEKPMITENFTSEE